MLIPLSVVMADILSSGSLQFSSISCNSLAILVPVWDCGDSSVSKRKLSNWLSGIHKMNCYACIGFKSRYRWSACP